MEELVMITPIVIIKLTWFNLTWLRNWSGKFVQKLFLWLMSQTLNGNIKNCYRKEKV